MRFEYRLNLRELLDLNRSSGYQRLKGGVVAALGAAHVLLGAWMAIFPSGERDPAIVFASGAAFVGLGLIAPSLAGFGTWALGWAPQITLEPGPNGLIFSDKAGAALLRWTELRKCYTTPSLYVMGFGANDPLALPKRCCDEAAWRTILEWMQSGKEGGAA